MGLVKLLLGNDKSLKSYILSEKIEESHLITYKSLVDNEEKVLVVSAEDGKWHIKKSSNIVILRNYTVIEDAILEDYSIFQINIIDSDETINLYCLPGILEKFKDYEVVAPTIKIGKAPDCNIIYRELVINEHHAVIQLDENRNWVLVANEKTNNIYVNNVLCKNKKLVYGDVIFIAGLKLIWMKGFIRVTDFKLINVNGLKEFNIIREDNSNYGDITGKEKNVSLYKENELFFHTPNLKMVSEHTIINLESPPNQENKNQMPTILAMGTFITFAVTSVSSLVTALIRRDIVSVITSIAMLCGSIIFPILINRWNKKQADIKENKRLEKYGQYLNDKKELIINTINSQAETLKALYGSSVECYSIITEKKESMWSREIKDKEFLNLRFGVGNEEADIEIKANTSEFVLEDDVLLDKMEEIKNAKLTMSNVPIINSLVENKVFAVIIKRHILKNYIDNIMMQLMAYYSSVDLKIVLLFNEKNIDVWNNYRCLAHTLSKEKDVRFFAYKDDDMKGISSYLENVYQERINLLKNAGGNSNYVTDKSSELYKNFDSYYLIITDDIIHTKNLEIVDKVLTDQSNYGFSLLILEEAINNLPSTCKQFVQIKEDQAQMLTEEVMSKGIKEFTPEFITGVDMSYMAYLISNIPVASTETVNTLPTSLEFLEMYKVGRIEQLNIMNRWNSNDPTISLSTPIGVHPSGELFELNLHEKSAGPHGLIAGSTGSGKSEFIITYILSMCVNYSPNEVQFVLIDYKGGGLAGAFENRDKGTKIPHLVGTITNLDTSEMNRTLVSIRSELQRRQRVFNETREALGESTIDIYKYQKHFRDGLVEEPIAHLFIISDEFAELKAQQPDFMDELISTARIGRSLGVHLILATQKPSGVVDDQIWSNTRFRVCLKVQSVSDSQEMLRREEAASIKEAGRFYLQVGYDEVFELGQSAWTGAKYVPADVIEKKIDDSINFINDSGIVVKTVNDTIKKEDIKDNGEQLTNIVEYLIDLSVKENIKTKDLWLPSMKEELYLGNLIKKYDFKTTQNEFKAIIGEYDDPEHQKQGLLTVDFTKSGNIVLYGMAGSGKENQIETMLYSLCLCHHPLNLNIYIMDFGAEVLKTFQSMPQVGDYLTSYDTDKIENLLKMLEREYQKRKEILSEYGGSFANFNKNFPNKMALMIIVINNYEAFSENFNNLEDSFNRLFRETSKFGMVFITTATAQNSLSFRISQNFSTVYAMRLADPYDYRYILDAPSGLIPKKVFGRGLTKVNDRALEYQAAYINVFENINQTVKTTAVNMINTYKVKTKSVPTIPSKINSSTMNKYIKDLSNVPLGVDVVDINIATFDFNTPRISIVTANDIKMCYEFLQEFYSLMSKIPNTTFAMYDSFMSVNVPSAIPTVPDANDFAQVICNVVTKPDQPEEHRVVFIAGMSDLLNSIYDEENKNRFIEILENASEYPNTSFIILDDYNNFKNLSTEKWYQNNITGRDCIWIGTGFEDQILFQLSKEIEGEAIPEYTNYMGYILIDSKSVLVKLIASEG